MSDTVPRSAPPPRATVAVLAVLAAAITLFCLRLWPEWRSNPDLSHGFFAPIIFGLLLLEARRAGPARWLAPTTGHAAAIGLLAACALGLLVVSGLLAASVGWSHALVLFVLATSLVFLLLAGLGVLAGSEVRAVPLNWISLVAILLWLLVAPLPHGTYARLTAALQGWVTEGVLDALHVLGVPARQRGNVIELARTTVGVEEACSGIRSLLSCLYAGCFFAAWQVRHTWGRVLLIGLAPVLAIGMNFVRSLALTLMANAGIDIAGFWHDLTGFAILGVTAAVLGALAWQLSPRTTDPVTLPPLGRPARAPLAVFWSAQAALAAVLLFFTYHSRAGVRPAAAVPDLAAFLPSRAEGWQVVTKPDLYRFSGVLQTEHLVERTYLKRAGDEAIQLTVYVAYWPAGRASVSLVASHTPDACWPGAGWTPVSPPRRHVALTAAGTPLRAAQHREFANAAGFPQHVWYWQVFDGRVIDPQAPYSVGALLRNALDYGFRRDGDQCFIRISSNQPWERLATEPLVREITANLARLGL